MVSAFVRISVPTLLSYREEPEVLFFTFSRTLCRCQLYIQPAGNSLEQQYTQSTTYISWKEELHRSTEVRCVLQCPSVEVNFLPLIVNTVALPDELSYIGAHGEDWDPAYVIHLYPPLTLRNLLPYSLRYLLEVCFLYSCYYYTIIVQSKFSFCFMCQFEVVFHVFEMHLL